MRGSRSPAAPSVAPSEARTDGRQSRRPADGQEAGPLVLYWWLLAALFVEYARPASYIPALEIPYLYTVLPLSLFGLSIVAPGLRPLRETFSDPIAKWVLVFLGLTFVSMLLPHSRALATGKFLAVLGYSILFLLITRIVTTRTRLRGVVFALLAAHFTLLAANPNVLLEPDTRNYIEGATFLGDGNDFGLSLCILLPLAIELAQSARRWVVQLLAWGSAGVVVLAITATQSRGAALGVAAILAYNWLRSPRKLRAFLASAAVGLSILLYAPPEFFARMGTVTSGQVDGSAQGRIDAWKAGLGMGFNNPILGVGAGSFGPRWGKTAHSTYVLALAELGLPGLACVLALVFGNLRLNRSLQRRLRTQAGTLPEEVVARDVGMLFATSAATVAFAVAGAFLSATYYPHLFVVTGVLVSARLLVRSDLDQAERVSASAEPRQNRTGNGRPSLVARSQIC